MISSTNFGPARNKLFLRGIADSSFNGPTQATVGQYLGDVRLNYNAPDPSLNLYDVQRVEVLPGPQGTLYGASSLGGIIHLVRNAPDNRETSATMSGGVSSTRFSGVGGDAAAMLNLPIIDGRLAAARRVCRSRARLHRRSVEGRKDINRMASYGQRLALRAEDLFGLTVDFGSLSSTLRTMTASMRYPARHR